MKAKEAVCQQQPRRQRVYEWQWEGFRCTSVLTETQGGDRKPSPCPRRSEVALLRNAFNPHSLHITVTDTLNLTYIITCARSLSVSLSLCYTHTHKSQLKTESQLQISQIISNPHMCSTHTHTHTTHTHKIYICGQFWQSMHFNYSTVQACSATI